MTFVDVALLRWPLEEERRLALAARGALRLLLVDADMSAPEAADCLEDWIRLPASQDDIDVRCRALATRSMVHIPESPGLDPDGVSGDEEAASTFIPESAGEHTVQTVQTALTPLQIRPQQDLRVALRPKGVAQRRQLGA